MASTKRYFFCGIGGSGMLPLSLIVKAGGADVSGSDRALDQGRTLPKFEFLRAQGIKLFAQDGSGVDRSDLTVVTSAAVEETVPDVVAARRLGAGLITRAELLAHLFNEAPVAIGVAGTSGKSTTTAMIGWILEANGRRPTIVNGAVMKNFVTSEVPFASAAVGEGKLFVCEVDESDGSIAHYRPKIALLNNVALDHKSIDELRSLFRGFVAKAETAVLGVDNSETAAIADALPASKRVTWSLHDPRADVFASRLHPKPDGVLFDLCEKGNLVCSDVSLPVPGRHNVANALAALAGCRAAGVELKEGARALGRFAGVRRRLEVVGSRNGITVIDDFAHNPDKIAATLRTLHEFPGRLLLMFQPHGFGPLRLMREGFIETFGQLMTRDDVLVMPEPVYFGGTVERSVSSADIVSGIRAQGRSAQAFPDRPSCGRALAEMARAGDRIVVMGARDDTLSQFASELLEQVSERLRMHD